MYIVVTTTVLMYMVPVDMYVQGDDVYNLHTRGALYR